MNRSRFYDPPFLLKISLLVCLVLVATAHRKGWMQRTVSAPVSVSAPYTQQATVLPVVAKQP